MPTMLSAQTLQIAEKVKFLALGDSYTIGQSVSMTERWPVQLIDTLRKKGLDCYDEKIIATTGWRTDDLMNAINNANLSNNYNLVSLLIGVNNYYQGRTAENYASEFKTLLNKAISLAGGNKSNVFVMSIPDYGYTPYGESNKEVISQGINNFNAINKSITSAAGVAYINITNISRRGLAEPDLVANDGLHPSGKMYKEWVDCIVAKANIIEPTGDSGTITNTLDERVGIQVYPNPFKTTLIFDNLPDTEDYVNLIMTNLEGKTVFASKTRISDSVLNLDMRSLAPGVFYYNLIGKKGILSQGKLIHL